jgi:hypothetical protein
MIETRQNKIEMFAGGGNIEGLKALFESGYNEDELDTALENAIAYSQIKTADYLISLGASVSGNGYSGVYYAVHNNQLEGLKYAILNGVDINVDNGMLLNTSIMTSINAKNCRITKWLLDNGADPKLITKKSLELFNEWGNDDLKTLIKKSDLTKGFRVCWCSSAQILKGQ